jgi:hypothetical protein
MGAFGHHVAFFNAVHDTDNKLGLSLHQKQLGFRAFQNEMGTTTKDAEYFRCITIHDSLEKSLGFVKICS